MTLLLHGQRLMLIDMERCTLCGECVRACVDAHPRDGRSRLFLLGHRFDHYLVPITCRSCRDPVCMIGCPVRSIQRGPNHEIQIKDWCIGCAMCAKNCPYDVLPDQNPRCVYACPHEAALRVDARLELPGA
jgi:Fe-S-cluster-containing dehydrogenase component